MEKQVKVQIDAGLEARPIAMLVQTASKYDSAVHLLSEGRKVNAKSIMGMMSMTLRAGDEVTVIAEGTDEAEAIAGIEAFLLNKEQ